MMAATASRGSARSGGKQRMVTKVGGGGDGRSAASSSSLLNNADDDRVKQGESPSWSSLTTIQPSLILIRTSRRRRCHHRLTLRRPRHRDGEVRGLRQLRSTASGRLEDIPHHRRILKFSDLL